MVLPVVLTVAGSDSGGGAGIQADLKTFHACGVHGVSATTSVTSQNTRGVQDRYDLPAAVVGSQLESIFTDFDVAALKTGMLANATLIRVVADAFRLYPHGPLVVDPVMVSSSGSLLLDLEAVSALVGELMPMAEIVTPNVPEAEALTGRSILSSEDMREAARDISLETGCRNVMLKGGHLATPAGSTDILFMREAGEWTEFTGELLEAKHAHGTGCVLSAALACGLAKGLDLRSAVARAKETVSTAIRNSLEVGHGSGPVHPPCAETDEQRGS